MDPPAWFSPATGVYSSTHAPLHLPDDPRLDLPTHVLFRSASHCRGPALLDAATGSSLSYAALRDAALRIASGLRRAGVSPGTVALIALPNSVVFPAVFLGVLAAGAVASPVNPLGSPEEIRRQATGCRASIAFARPGYAWKLDGLRVVPVPDLLEFDRAEFPEFAALLSADLDEAAGVPARQDDVAALLYSSGTSGVSKCVALTHRNLISTVELFARLVVSQYGGDPSTNVYLCALPMFHVFALSMFAARVLAVGATVVVMRRFEVGEAVRAIETYGVTHFPVVPPMLAALAKAKGVLRCALPSLRQVSCGAAPAGEGLIKEFLSCFPHVDFIQGYGMTETTAVGTRGFNAIHRKYASVGLLAPNMEAKVVDPNTMRCLPPGEKGELWLRGPAIMKGYINDEAATISTIVKDGWLKTGDIAYFDKDGFLFLSDRLKDTIKYKGYQIAPADLEAVLLSHPEIVDTSVMGSAVDNDSGEIPVAFVVKKTKSILCSEDIISYVAKKVAPYKKVRKVVFVDSIPRSPTGKILRRLLKDNRISKM